MKPEADIKDRRNDATLLLRRNIMIALGKVSEETKGAPLPPRYDIVDNKQVPGDEFEP